MVPAINATTETPQAHLQLQREPFILVFEVCLCLPLLCQQDVVTAEVVAGDV
jgi:hypothetical protein